MSICIGRRPRARRPLERLQTTSFCERLRAAESLRARLAGEPSETATISGPFTPAPKFFEIRSYAWRAVVDVDSAATSFWPRFSDSSGIASGIRIASAASPATTGWLATRAAHFAHRPCLRTSRRAGGRARAAS